MSHARWAQSEEIEWVQCAKSCTHLLSQGFDGIPDSNIAVFNVLQDHGLVLANPENKAIWRAKVTGASGWTHTFTLLKCSPALIWDASERPASYDGIVRVENNAVINSNVPNEAAAPDSLVRTTDLVTTRSIKQPSSDTQDAIEDVLALIGDDPEMTSPSDTLRIPVTSVPAPAPIEHIPSTEATLSAQTPIQPENSPGMAFIAWLRDGIESRRLKINDAKALIHTVDGTAFLVTPGMFQRYLQEHPELAGIARKEKLDGWQWAQKKFERLRLHRKQNSGLNIWTCEVTGPRKSRRLHGYLLQDGSTLFSEMPPDNPHLKLS